MNRLGLALSGGGFRAAFFHLGVLTWLAHHRALRRVSVISTVSGGSIVGALYSLHVKRLLTNTGGTDEDFAEAVRTTQAQLTWAVKRNLRMRTFSDLRANVRMRKASYSRTDRLAELLDEHLYQPVWNELWPGDPRRGMVRMRDLAIPADAAEVAPELVVNATDLPTGRRWVFTPHECGLASAPEWDEGIGRELQLPGLHPYEDLVVKPPGLPPLADLEVGVAAAASAAVPGLFHPIAITGFPGYYPLRAQLVDGGVVDNQGVTPLLAAGCSHVIASDAGGQLTIAADTGTSAFASASRSQSIQYGFVRIGGLRFAGETAEAGVAHSHVGLGDSLGTPPDDADARTAALRTDLDAFSEIERTALVRRGFDVAAETLGGVVAPFAAEGALEASPPPALPPTPRHLRRLRTGQSTLGKPFRCSVWAWVVSALALGTLGLAAWRWGPVIGSRIAAAVTAGAEASIPVVSGALREVSAFWASAGDWLTADIARWQALPFTFGVLLATYAFVRHRQVTTRLLRIGPRTARALDLLFRSTRMLVAVGAWAGVWFYLLLLNPLFLRKGRTSEE